MTPAADGATLADGTTLADGATRGDGTTSAHVRSRNQAPPRGPVPTFPDRMTILVGLLG